MGLNDDMKDFFNNEKIEIILDNKLSFKHKLNIGEKDYKYLNNAKNLQEFTEILIGGLTAAGIAYGGFLVTLSTLGQIGLAIGFVSTPIGWITLAGLGGAGLMYGSKKVLKKADKASFDKIPKYISTPLDILADNLMNLFLPIVIKISLLDGKFDPEEKTAIISYLAINWGYNRNYVKEKLDATYKNQSKFNYADIKKSLNIITKGTNGLDYNDIKLEITKMVTEVINSVNKSTSRKEEELKILKKLL